MAASQTIFFVLQAQTQLTQAEVNLVTTQIAYQEALTAVDRSGGSLLERHQIQISEVGR
ncbi:MAG: hypothetical protein AB1898_02195 [Acidobacteriota bacterium]